MPDDLTPDERAAIADFERRNGVTRLPACRTSGPDYRWNPKTQQLAAIDPDAAYRRLRGRVPSPGARQRRARLPALIEAGYSGPQIAEVLGVSVHVVYHDCRLTGLRIRDGRPALAAPGAA